jgi:putative flavoprotein involved in K+ transport
MNMHERYSTIVVGGGQAGLAAAHYLSLVGDDYLVLDAGPGFGHSWRSRWDSLMLFTPAKFNVLPGMPFPAADFHFPSKDEAGAYLEAYAQHINPPVRFNSRVDSLARDGEGFVVDSGGRHYTTSRVVVATGAYQEPRVPDFAGQLDRKITQLHSNSYKNFHQLPQGPILVVGAGNSGAEIAVELAGAGRDVMLAGRDVGRIPADRVGKLLGGRPYWWLISHLLSVHTPIGRRVQKASLTKGTPLIGLRPSAITGAGVRRVERVTGVSQGMPTLANGQRLEISAILWATGFRPNYRWIQMPIFDEHGYPRHDRGMVPEVPGLYFLGLPFQTSLSSSLLGGVGADAGVIARHLSHRTSKRLAVLPASA